MSSNPASATSFPRDRSRLIAWSPWTASPVSAKTCRPDAEEIRRSSPARTTLNGSTSTTPTVLEEFREADCARILPLEEDRPLLLLFAVGRLAATVGGERTTDAIGLPSNGLRRESYVG